MKISESLKKLLKKQKSTEQSFKEETEENSPKVSHLEKFCSDNPDSVECRIYDV